MRRLQIVSVHDVNLGTHRGLYIEDLAHDFVCIYGSNESGKSTLAEFLQWSVGGPAGKAASALRFIGTDESRKVGGRVLSQIDNETIEIEARFEILLAGTPNDHRTAAFQNRQLDGKAFALTLGNVNSDDYALIYRLRGAELGQAGESDAFSDLFTSIAVGSASSSVNPREALSSLTKDAADLKKRIKPLEKEKKQLRGKIVSAQHRPDELDELESEFATHNESVERLKAEIEQLYHRKSLADKALNILPSKQSLLKAGATLEDIGPISEEWRDVAGSSESFSQAQAAIDDQVGQVSAKRQKLNDLLSKSGLTSSAIEGHELSIIERRDLLDAAKRITTSQSKFEEMLTDHALLQQSIESRKIQIKHAADALGIQDSNFDPFIGQATTIRTWVGSATLWLQSENEASAAEDTRRGLAAEVAELTKNPPSTTAKSSPRTALRIGFGVTGLVAALGTAGINPYLAIVILFGAAMIAMLLPDSSKTATQADTRLEVTRQKLLDGSYSAEVARSKADRLGAALTDSLRSLVAPATSDPSLAVSHINQLAALAELVTTQASDQLQLENDAAELAARKDDISVAQGDLARLLRERNIYLAPPIDVFSEWLFSYEEALRSSIDLASAEARLAELKLNRDSLVDSVAEDLAGLTPDQVLTKVLDEALRLNRITEAEGLRSEATVAIATLGESALEVESVLASHSDEQSLQRLQAELKDSIDQLDSKREEAFTLRNEAGRAITTLYSFEVLAQLLGEQAQVEEEIGELEDRIDVIERSAEILSQVIDQYESENQDPLIKQAQNLVHQVVSDWGELLYSRNERGKVVIDRRNSLGRLADSKLSDGARALLYLALRLAFAKSDADRRGIALPILCDDPLVHLDDSRRIGAIALLAGSSQTHQVMLFTCDTATRDMAAEAGAKIVAL